MPKELWDRGQEYWVKYEDLFCTFKEVGSYSKLDSLGRFEIKVPLINSTEVSWTGNILISTRYWSQVRPIICSMTSSLDIPSSWAKMPLAKRTAGASYPND